ncbi:MAG: fibronectin type III domain-containing protein [Clostridia bacterium]|nr:fibronectin type III domain-containing protein [Clostridia bacterium]
MKRISKILVTLIFALGLICSGAVPAFAASLGKVKSLKAKDVTYSSVTLTWAKVSGAKGYEVERLSGKKWVSVNATVKTNSLKITGLKTGTTYKYRVRAYKTNFLGRKNSFGSYSSTVSVKPSVAKVTGLKVSSVNTTSAKLSWSKVSGASGYYVQQYKSKKWKTIKTVTKNSYSLTGLKLGSSYKFRVVAYRTVSKKKYAGTASSSVTVKPAVPAVTNLKATVDVTSAKLSWSKVSTASGYYVQQYKSKKWSTIKTIKSNKTVSLTVSKLTPNKTYKFRVLAYKGSYKSAASSTLSVTPQVYAPTSFKASSIKAESLKLSWTASSNGEGYRVEQYIDGAWTQIAETAETSLTVKELSAGTTYKFRVSAYKGSYVSSYASKDVTTLCAQVEGLKVTSVVTAAKASSQRVTLSWKETPAAAGYTVYYAESTASSWKTYKTLADTEVTVSNLSLNKDYKFAVAAYHSENGSKAYGAKSDAVVAGLSKQAKTDYILMAVNAINASKKEQTKVTVDYNNKIYTNIDNIALKWGLIDHEFDDIESLMKFLASVGGEDIDTSDISTEMSETIDSKKTFEYGQCWEVNPETGYNTLTTLNQHIAPTNAEAYLYKAEEIENIDKKVSNITYTVNEDGSCTVLFNVVQETISNTGGGTPVHDGLTQGNTTISTDSETTMKMVMGESTIEATVNADGTLDDLYIYSPFTLYAGLTGTSDGKGFQLGINTTGSYTTSYKFSREAISE